MRIDCSESVPQPTGLSRDGLEALEMYRPHVKVMVAGWNPMSSDLTRALPMLTVSDVQKPVLFCKGGLENWLE